MSLTIVVLGAHLHSYYASHVKCAFLTGRFWCFTRITYMSIAFLYAKRFVGPITPTILALRNEIYDLPYDEIDWNKARNTCAKVCHYPSYLYKNIIASPCDIYPFVASMDHILPQLTMYKSYVNLVLSFEDLLCPLQIRSHFLFLLGIYLLLRA